MLGKKKKVDIMIFSDFTILINLRNITSINNNIEILEINFIFILIVLNLP